MLRIVAIAGIVVVLGLLALVASTRPRREREGTVVEEVTRAALPSRPRAAAAPVLRAPALKDEGLSHLVGWVTGAPPGKELSVAADDGRQSYEAGIDEATGAFALHVPAGVFTLTAQVDGLVAVREGVPALAGRTQTLTLALQPGATLAGLTRTPPGAPREKNDVEVVVRRAGTTVVVDHTSTAEDGSFEIDGLVPGRFYDLTFAGKGIRRRALPGVKAPVAGLSVDLQRGPRLRGIIGRGPDGACPVDWVRVKEVDPDRDDVEPLRDQAAPVDGHCSFHFDRLLAEGELQVLATQNGWHLVARVRIPETGDPEPVCLNPPCPALGPDLRARLTATLVGSREGGTFGVTTSIGRGCASPGTTCALEDLPVGVPVELNVRASGCSFRNLTVGPLHDGENAVSVTCEPTVTIQGTIRRPDGAPTPWNVEIRCGGAPSRRTSHAGSGSFFFALDCPTGTTDLDYRLAGTGRWQSSPVSGRSHPLVDVVLDQ